MKGEAIHDRQRPAARAVGLADSRMKRVERKCRAPFGQSTPRERERAAPDADVRRRFLERVVARGEQAEVGRSRGTLPRRSNCGIQKRFRFGSLPTITSRKAGLSRTIAAA